MKIECFTFNSTTMYLNKNVVVPMNLNVTFWFIFRVKGLLPIDFLISVMFKPSISVNSDKKHYR